MAFLGKGEKCKVNHHDPLNTSKGDSQNNSAATILTDAMEQILTRKEMKVDLFLNTVADYISEELEEKNRGDEQHQLQPPQQMKIATPQAGKMTSTKWKGVRQRRPRKKTNKSCWIWQMTDCLVCQS
jgi:hypothetical protein